MDSYFRISYMPNMHRTGYTWEYKLLCALEDPTPHLDNRTGKMNLTLKQHQGPVVSPLEHILERNIQERARTVRSNNKVKKQKNVRDRPHFSGSFCFHMYFPKFTQFIIQYYIKFHHSIGRKFIGS